MKIGGRHDAECLVLSFLTSFLPLEKTKYWLCGCLPVLFLGIEPSDRWEQGTIPAKTTSAQPALLWLTTTPHVKKPGNHYSVVLHQTRNLCVLQHLLHVDLREPDRSEKWRPVPCCRNLVMKDVQCSPTYLQPHPLLWPALLSGALYSFTFLRFVCVNNWIILIYTSLKRLLSPEITWVY